MSEGKVNFSSKNGYCPECIAFGRQWYIKDRFIGGSAYEYCLMSKSVEKPISYAFQSKNEIAAWLNGAENNTEYTDDVAEYIISRYIDWKSDFSNKALICRQDERYIYDKKKNTLTVVADAKQESGWFDSYRECLKIAKEILSSIEKKERSMKTNFPLLIANGLKEHCARWNYPWLERLKENTTSENFYKLFCKITKTYFVHDSANHYNVTFSKDGTVTVKRCGPDYDKRGLDTVLNIQDILPLLVEGDVKISTNKMFNKDVKKSICPVCGKEFFTSDGNQKHCSVECSLWDELKNNM